jgi:cysteine-S-conjugate beta-lyase
MKTETDLIHLGLAPDTFDGIVNMPLARASTILFKNLADFEAGERGEYPLPVYGRYGNPTQRALEDMIAKLEGADAALVVPSGLAAISSALMAFLKAGDHLLITDAVYGPARRFVDQILKRYGVEVTYFEPTIGKDIAKLFKRNTKVVYVESPGSQTFEVMDIPAIAKVAHARDAVVIADNTWATPLHFRALEKGVDVVLHSGTKYISGHSDIMMGTLACRERHLKELLYTARNLGACPSADSCWLALRGLRTMAVRLKHHQESATKVAQWIKKRPEVVEVLYPALPGAPGHDIWKRDFTGACGLFGVQLKPVSHAALANFVDGLELFGIGYSWGGFESLITTNDMRKARTAKAWPHKGPLIRLHIGLEAVDDLIKDLEKGFARMKKG